MAPVRSLWWIAVFVLAITGIAAAEPDRVRQDGRAATLLGQRLAAVARSHAKSPGGQQFWEDARARIAASNAATDARTDTAAGHIGFMTHANDTIAESPVAPGLKCLDRSETSRRAVFLFAYKDPLASEAGKALLAFDAYARLYNAHVSRSGALGDTSCVLTGW